MLGVWQIERGVNVLGGDCCEKARLRVAEPYGVIRALTGEGEGAQATD